MPRFSSPQKPSMLFTVLPVRLTYSSALWFTVSFFFQAEDGIRYSSVTGVQTCALPILQIAPNRLVNLCREPMLNGYSPDCAAGAANRKVAPIARVRGFFVERRANMARFLRIRHVVKTDRAPMSKSRRFVGSSRTAAIGHSRKTRLFHRSRKELLFST